MNRLELRYKPENESSGELLAKVQSGKFSGIGSAWLRVEDLRSFVKHSLAFPLDANALPEIFGGHLVGERQILEKHLAIKIEPCGSRGALRVSIELAVPIYDSHPLWKAENDTLGHSLMTRFLVTYNDLDAFARDFLEVIDGTKDTATLSATFHE